MIEILALVAGHVPAARAKISIISRHYCRFYGVSNISKFELISLIALLKEHPGLLLVTSVNASELFTQVETIEYSSDFTLVLIRKYHLLLSQWFMNLFL